MSGATCQTLCTLGRCPKQTLDGPTGKDFAIVEGSLDLVIAEVKERGEHYRSKKQDNLAAEMFRLMHWITDLKEDRS